MSDASTCAQALGRAAVEHLAACSPAAGPTSTIQSAWRIDVQLVLDDEQRVARRLQASSARAAPRCPPDAGRRTARRARRRRRTGSSGPASPGAAAAARPATASACCARARGSRGRGSSSTRDSRGDALRDDALFLRQVRRAAHVGRAACADRRRRRGARVARAALAARRRGRAPASASRRAAQHATGSAAGATSRRCRGPANVTASASRLQPLAAGRPGSRADHEARDALLHQRALRRRERLQHVACARR